MIYNRENFGERLKQIRTLNGLTMLALGKEIGTSASRIKSWESGDSVPSANWIVKISERFNISTDLLLKNDPMSKIDWSQKMYNLSEEIELYNSLKEPEENPNSQSYDGLELTDEDWDDIKNGTYLLKEQLKNNEIKNEFEKNSSYLIKEGEITDQEWEDIMNGTYLLKNDPKVYYSGKIKFLLPKLSEQDLLELYTLAEVKSRKNV